MKEQIIQSMVNAGISPEKAAAHWGAFVRDVCDGDEPTPAGLAMLKDSQIEASMKPMAAAAILAAIRGAKGSGTAKKYRAGRSYTAEQYAEHYERDPENAALVADITRATTVDGKPRPWVIAPGKFRPEQSAQYIAWHMAEDPAPAVIMVDGQPVAPVMPGEERKKSERLYYVDPFTPGAFLDVHGVSARTGASFADYSPESLSAMAFLFTKKLNGEGNLTLSRLAREYRGKAPAEILALFPDVLAAWNADPKRRPAPKRAKVSVDPFVEPTPVAAPVVGAASTAGFDARAAAAAIIDAGAAESRDQFLGGLPPQLTGSLPRAPTPSAQVLSDLATLARMSLTDGSRPERVYLENAIHLIAPRHQAATLRAMLAPAQPAPPLIYVMGGEYERRAGQTLKSHLAVHERDGQVRVVIDSDMRPGEVRTTWHAKQVAAAAIVVFLVSIDTVNAIEPPRGLRVIPVLVRGCSWQEALGDIAALPRSNRPASEDDWPGIASEIAKIAKGRG